MSVDSEQGEGEKSNSLCVVLFILRRGHFFFLLLCLIDAFCKAETDAFLETRKQVGLCIKPVSKAHLKSLTRYWLHCVRLPSDFWNKSSQRIVHFVFELDLRSLHMFGSQQPVVGSSTSRQFLKSKHTNTLSHNNVF